MAKIENDFLGLNEVNGDCTVTANIWVNNEMSMVRFASNSNSVKRAFNSKKRYSLDNTMKLINSGLKKNKVEVLRAILYRAKVTENKGIPMGHRGCVNVGVLNGVKNFL